MNTTDRRKKIYETGLKSPVLSKIPIKVQQVSTVSSYYHEISVTADGEIKKNDLFFDNNGELWEAQIINLDGSHKLINFKSRFPVPVVTELIAIIL